MTYFGTFVTHAGPVCDVPDTDCWAQNGTKWQHPWSCFYEFQTSVFQQTEPEVKNCRVFSGIPWRNRTLFKVIFHWWYNTGWALGTVKWAVSKYVVHALHSWWFHTEIRIIAFLSAVGFSPYSWLSSGGVLHNRGPVWFPARFNPGSAL